MPIAPPEPLPFRPRALTPALHERQPGRAERPKMADGTLVPRVYQDKAAERAIEENV